MHRRHRHTQHIDVTACTRTDGPGKGTTSTSSSRSIHPITASTPVRRGRSVGSRCIRSTTRPRGSSGKPTGKFRSSSHNWGARAHTWAMAHGASFLLFPLSSFTTFYFRGEILLLLFFSALCETQTLKLAGIIRFTLAFSRLLRRRCTQKPKSFQDFLSYQNLFNLIHACSIKYRRK